MKSTLLNMVLVLFGITFIGSAGVGLVYVVTKEPIAQAKAAAKVIALKKVLPPFENTTTMELVIDGMPLFVHTATEGEQIVGYAVESMTKIAFGGVISMMVGFTPEGEVINVNVLDHTETPGLGDKITLDGNVLINAIAGQDLESKKLVDGKLAITKDGGDVDVLTAATITSRAYVDAINRAWMAYNSVSKNIEPTDVSSGASQSSSNSQKVKENE